MVDINLPAIANIPPTRGIRPGEEKLKRHKVKKKGKEEDEKDKTPPEKGHVNITV